jgi:hypothetical protein
MQNWGVSRVKIRSDKSIILSQKKIVWNLFLGAICSSRQDAPFAPICSGIGVSAPRSGHPRGFHTTLDDGGGVPLCETQKLAEPSTAAWGMSFLMQSTILEAVTTRLVSQKALTDKQGHCDCAHEHKPLVARWMCQSTQNISD